jgi:hypothetical protein
LWPLPNLLSLILFACWSRKTFLSPNHL